jgi:ubiquinone/menaquinone biosynthesis C-methylase UbiE
MSFPLIQVRYTKKPWRAKTSTKEEAEHLELMHSVFCRVFDDRLIFPPVRAPKRVLDCGFGAGDWAFEVARAFPDCEVQEIYASFPGSRALQRA